MPEPRIKSAGTLVLYVKAETQSYICRRNQPSPKHTKVPDFTEIGERYWMERIHYVIVFGQYSSSCGQSLHIFLGCNTLYVLAMHLITREYVFQYLNATGPPQQKSRQDRSVIPR